MRDVKNNWALLAGVSIVSFGGALVYALFGENSPAIALYFILASFGLAGFTFYWFARHKPALKAPAWAYILVVFGLEAGAFFGGAIEDTRAIGAWLAVGIAFIFYGLLERSRLISLTGASAVVVAVLVYIFSPPALGVVLEVLTGIIFGYAALILKRTGG